jgi:DNA-binding transcriptional MerR regulator
MFGVSRSELGRRLQISEATIRNWERRGLVVPEASGRRGAAVSFAPDQCLRARAIRHLAAEGILLSQIAEALGARGSAR